MFSVVSMQSIVRNDHFALIEFVVVHSELQNTL